MNLLESLLFFACVSEICFSLETEDGVCEAVDICESRTSGTIPPSWVVYLHNYEQAKLLQAKGCKDDVIVEGVSIHCSYATTIREDLKVFGKISYEELEKARQSDRHSVTYQLIQGRLYRSPDCLFPSRCQGIEHFIMKVKDKLPNFEIVVNTHDWPFINRHFYSKAVPLFSFSKTRDHYDIFFPAWTFWAGGPAIKQYPTGLGRWDLMREILEKSGFEKWSWSKKSDSAFFRGSRTSPERDNLVTLSQKKPHFVDAQFTKNQAWKSVKDTLGMHPADEVLLEDHCRYKYLFNFRGVAASFRFKHLFLCGSLVFHVGDDWYEFFYGAMRPWFHYIPVPNEASEEELEDLIAFAKAHPAISRNIAENGRDFILNRLRMVDIDSYWLALLNSYSKLLDFEVVTAREHFTEILN